MLLLIEVGSIREIPDATFPLVMHCGHAKTETANVILVCRVIEKYLDLVNYKAAQIRRQLLQNALGGDKKRRSACHSHEVPRNTT